MPFFRRIEISPQLNKIQQNGLQAEDMRSGTTFSCENFWWRAVLICDQNIEEYPKIPVFAKNEKGWGVFSRVSIAKNKRRNRIF